MTVPCGVGLSTFSGLPLSSRPLVQFTLTNGLPDKNSPVARSRTYQNPLRLAHNMTLRVAPCHGFWYVLDRDLHGVVVELVVRSELKMPFQLTGVRVERH